jgi:hypothetical protein
LLKESTDYGEGALPHCFRKYPTVNVKYGHDE